MEDKSKKNSKVEIVRFHDFVDTKEVKPKLSKEESEEIKKKLTRLLTVLVIVGTLFLTFIFTNNSFKSSSAKRLNNTTDNNNQIENTETINNKVPEGDVSLNDLSIEKYKNIITINQYDTLFNKNLKNIFLSSNFNTVDNYNKLYFASKSESVKKYLESAGILNHEYGCNKSGVIEFDETVMKSAMEEVFGPRVIYQNIDFELPYYINETLINVYNVSFSNGKYTMSCVSNYKKDLKLVIQSKINKVTNTNNRLVFEINAVFINKNGVFSDPKTTKLITNDANTTYDNYISKGTNYKYIFEKSAVDDNYYLQRMEQ